MLDAASTEAALPYPDLAQSIRAVLGGKARGEAHAPPRLILPLPASPGANLLAMPATDGELAITKLVTVHPGNATRGLPTIQGEVVVMRADTGERLGILDGATVTARRTAALSLLAAKVLAPDPQGPLLILGAGAQGRSHLEAFQAGLGTRRVFIRSRREQSSRDLAARARELGMEVEVVGQIEEALGEAALIVTATTSAEPVLPEGVREDAFVAAVGSFRPDRAELPAGLVRRAARVVVDDMEGAREEAGDLLLAEQSGVWAWDETVTLEDILSGDASGEPVDGPVVFKSVGSALWDLAAARLAFAGDLDAHTEG